MNDLRLQCLPAHTATVVVRRLARYTRLLALAAAAAVPPGAALAQHPLTILPLDDPAYHQLEALDRAGCAAGRLGPYRPFLVRDVRARLRSATTDPACPALLVDALQRRFGADSLPVGESPMDSLRLLGVEPDTSRARSEIESQAKEGVSAGAALTLRVTSIGDREFRPLWRDVRPTSEGTPPFVALLRGRLRYSGGPRFLAVSEAYLQSDRRNDPTVRAKTVRGSSGFLDVGAAYLNGQLGPFDISFGRADEAWLGQGRESLVLSAHGPMMDRLMISGRWRRVQARAVVALLDRVTLTESQDSLATGTGNVALDRAIVGHALTWTPVPALELTVGETMLFARRGSTLDLTYFNPIVPLIVAQSDTGRSASAPRDNLMIFGEATFRVGAFQARGELLIDDIQVDEEDREQTVDQLGFAVEGSLALPTTQPAFARVRYRRIGSFTYSRPFYSEVYQQYGTPLGSELGPDADRADAELEYWPNGVLQIGAGVSIWRHGATRLERRPAEGPNFRTGLPFPSVRPERPTVQRATVWTFSVRVLSSWLPVSAVAEAANIGNVNNVAGPTALYLRAYLAGTYAIRFP